MTIKNVLTITGGMSHQFPSLRQCRHQIGMGGASNIKYIIREREMNLNRLFMLALTRVVPSALALAAAGGVHAQTVCSNGTGNNNGFFYSFFLSSGSACMTMGANGNYSTSYSLGSSGDMVAGKGWNPGSLTRVAGYNAGVFNPGNNSYLALYGWSENPLIEYYVVDDWGGFTPPGNGAQVLGQVTSDGGTYNIYKVERFNAPNITGINQNFFQFWSVRTSKRPQGQNNTITFNNHVKAWASHGLNLGALQYQIIITEGFGSNGSSNVTAWKIQ
jgi:endo-1,4-beta-xylanase